MNPVVFSRASDLWETPPELVTRYGPFDLDLAATAATAKAPRWFGPDHDDPACRDALAVADWTAYGRWAWLNPPYSQTARFLDHLHRQSRPFKVVALLPARTDTAWWHTYVWLGTASRQGVRVEFLPGRVRFVGGAHPAPFPSVILTFRR